MSLLKLNRAGVIAVGAALALSCISMVSASDELKPVKCNHTKPCLTVTNGTGSAVVGNGGSSSAAVIGASAGNTGVSGMSTTGDGVDGASGGSGAGVSGSSLNGDGVSGISGNADGLFGESVGDGVFAETTGGFGVGVVGVDGDFGSSDFSIGVLAEVAGNEPGTLSFGGLGDGADIYGGSNGSGIFTDNGSSVPAFESEAFGSEAVEGLGFSPTSYAAEFLNESEGSGSVFGPALYVGNAINGSFMSVDGNGNVSASGTITGGVFAVHHVTADGRHVVAYAAESSKSTIEDFGSGRVVAGRGVVHLENAFAKTLNLNAGYHVYITPNGDNRGVYVEKGNDSFVVHEAQGGHSSFSFDYRIVGSPADAHGARLAQYVKPMAPKDFSKAGAEKARQLGISKYNKAKAQVTRARVEAKRHMQMAAFHQMFGR